MEKETLLLKEYDQINDYNRTLFNIALGWYTFFVTANLFVIGIISNKYITGKFGSKDLILAISLLFFVVNILSIIGTFYGKKYFHNRIDRINNISRELVESGDITSPIKFELIKIVILFIRLSLLAITGFWLFLIILIVLKSNVI